MAAWSSAVWFLHERDACDVGERLTQGQVVGLQVTDAGPEQPEGAGELPSVAGRPFFIVILTASLISRLVLHLTQYASAAMNSPSGSNPASTPLEGDPSSCGVYSQAQARLLALTQRDF